MRTLSQTSTPRLPAADASRFPIFPMRSGRLHQTTHLNCPPDLSSAFQRQSPETPTLRGAIVSNPYSLSSGASSSRFRSPQTRKACATFRGQSNKDGSRLHVPHLGHQLLAGPKLRLQIPFYPHVVTTKVKFLVDDIVVEPCFARTPSRASCFPQAAKRKFYPISHAYKHAPVVP